MKFELTRLPDYNDESMLAELRRVAGLMAPRQALTIARFNEYAKVDASSVRRRFGGWGNALSAAGLSHLYSGRTISSKMRSQDARRMRDDEIIGELRRVASEIGSETLTQAQFDARCEISASAVRRRFGSWAKGLAAAGLRPVSMGRRYSEDDYFENLLAVWTKLGRQPRYAEMALPPSSISPGAYEARWGSWTKALAAFVEKMNADETPAVVQGGDEGAATPPPAAVLLATENRRKIPLGLRYNVLRRDNFKCVLCGNSPAVDPTCRLHVDHVLPFTKGGRTTEGNLRTLCEACNVGKSNKV